MFKLKLSFILTFSWYIYTQFKKETYAILEWETMSIRRENKRLCFVFFPFLRVLIKEKRMKIYLIIIQNFSKLFNISFNVLSIQRLTLILSFSLFLLFFPCSLPNTRKSRIEIED